LGFLNYTHPYAIKNILSKHACIRPTPSLPTELG
jgi:hypothetical protein